MRADSLRYARAAAALVGVELQTNQVSQLERFHRWLEEEAITAGGIGPNERERLWRRHIADSLLFAVDWGETKTCLDVGSGVGLPGIPLAVVFPDTRFTLLDRAGRRSRLARRAVSILGLANCLVVESDVAQIDGPFERIVSRASLPPETLMFHVKRLLSLRGIALIGFSHQQNSQPDLDFGVPDLEISLLAFPREILDSAVSLLRIEAT